MLPEKPPNIPNSLSRIEGYSRLDADDVVQLLKLHIISAFKYYGSKENMLWNLSYLGGEHTMKHVNVVDRFLKDRELQAIAEKKGVDTYDLIREFMMMEVD